MTVTGLWLLWAGSRSLWPVCQQAFSLWKRAKTEWEPPKWMRLKDNHSAVCVPQWVRFIYKEFSFFCFKRWSLGTVSANIVRNGLWCCGAIFSFTLAPLNFHPGATLMMWSSGDVLVKLAFTFSCTLVFTSFKRNARVHVGYLRNPETGWLSHRSGSWNQYVRLLGGSHTVSNLHRLATCRHTCTHAGETPVHSQMTDRVGDLHMWTGLMIDPTCIHMHSENHRHAHIDGGLV